MNYNEAKEQLINGQVISRTSWKGKTISLNVDNNKLLDINNHITLDFLNKLDYIKNKIDSDNKKLKKKDKVSFKPHTTDLNNTVEFSWLESQEDDIEDWFVV